MTAPGTLPPTPGPPAAVEPLDRIVLAGFVLAVAGIAPLAMAGGLVGAPVCAFRLRARPDLGQRSVGLATAGVVLGLVTGAVPLAVVAVVSVDDHVVAAVAAVVAYEVVVVVASGLGGRWNWLWAIGAPVVTAAVAGLVVAAIYALVWLFVLIVRELVEAVFSGGS